MVYSAKNETTSLSYRKQRIELICEKWGLERINPFIAAFRVPEKEFDELLFAIKLYISN